MVKEPITEFVRGIIVEVGEETIKVNWKVGPDGKDNSQKDYLKSNFKSLEKEVGKLEKDIMFGAKIKVYPDRIEWKVSPYQIVLPEFNWDEIPKL